MEPFINIKDTVEFVRSFIGEAKDLKLPISDELNDSMGMNMAIIGDSLLAKGFTPNGFEQKDSYRIYLYKSDNKVNYYPITPGTRNKPTTVWRFFEEDDKCPEMYKKGVGWIENKSLFQALAKGEISDSDIITEAAAKNIILEIESLKI